MKKKKADKDAKSKDARTTAGDGEVFEKALEKVAADEKKAKGGLAVSPVVPVSTGAPAGGGVTPPTVPYGLRDFFAEFDSAPNDLSVLAENELKKQGRVERYTQKKVEDYLTFALQKELYGVPISKVREIIKPIPLTFVPRMPAWTAGILSLRGSIVPVFSLGLKLGLGHGELTRSTRIVVFEDADELIGFYVDEVSEVVRLPLHAVEPPPQWRGAQDQDLIRGVGRVESKMIILLEFDSLVATLRTAA